MPQRAELKELLIIFILSFFNLLKLKVGKQKGSTHVGFGE